MGILDRLHLRVRPPQMMSDFIDDDLLQDVASRYVGREPLIHHRTTDSNITGGRPPDDQMDNSASGSPVETCQHPFALQHWPLQCHAIRILLDRDDDGSKVIPKNLC